MADVLTPSQIEEITSSADTTHLRIQGEYFIDANKQALELLEVSSLTIFKSLHPAMISPEFQPDGQSSKIKANKLFALLFEYGSLKFSWQHISLKGNVFDVDVLLIVDKNDTQNIIDVYWTLLR